MNAHIISLGELLTTHGTGKWLRTRLKWRKIILEWNKNGFHHHLHEFLNVDSNVMLSGTFDYNVDTFSFEYRHEPSNAFQMTICVRILSHNDGTDRNVNRTKNIRNMKEQFNFVTWFGMSKDMDRKVDLHGFACVELRPLFVWMTFYK